MKKTISVLLAVLLAFSAFASPVCAAANSSDFITAEKDFGEVSFDADYAVVGEPLRVLVGGEEKENLIYRWYIDGKRIANDTNEYTPIEYDMQSMISVEVLDGKATVIGVANMFLSNLPVIYIETQDRQPITSKTNYIDAQMKIQGNDEYNSESELYNGKTEIRGRGNSTWAADKKPYKLKLDSKADLFGMGKNKHWVLLSNPFDTSLLRNQVSYNLADDFGIDYEKSVWVDVVLNGKVVGNYQLCEHIRVGDDRVEITDWEGIAEDAAKAIYNENKSTMSKADRDELIDIMSADMSWTTSDKVVFNDVTYTVSDYIDIPDINGGYLIEVVKNGDEYTFETQRGVCVDIDTPEVLSEDMLNCIQGYYQAFENALFAEDFCTEYNGQLMRYTDFIDLESFVKGFLLNELFENFDFGRTSTWMSKDVDGKLVYGPVWDMDNTLTSTAFFRWTSLNVDWLRRLLSDPIFLQELRKAYFEYRYTAINDLIKDGGDIDTALATIAKSAKHNDYVWNNQIGYEENAADLRLRLQNKINWLDSVLTDMPSAYASMASNISNMNYVNSDALTLSFDKSTATLNISFADTVPSYVKIFADGQLFGTYETNDTSTAITLDGLRENAVITAVCYDENSAVLFGSYCITENEIVKVFVSSHISKFTYNAGEALSLDDIELTARYSDGTEKKVKPQLAYTYVKDALSEQLFSYDKVTDEIGKTYIVLRYENCFKEYEIQVNPRENYRDVITMIKKLPKEINGNGFVRELFEAKVAYDALSAEAKAKVTNVSKLDNLMAGLSDTESELTGVVACVADGTFRINTRSSILVVSTGNPGKIVFTNPDSTTSTYSTTSPAYLYKKTVGDYTVSTIRHLIPNNENHEFAITPVYTDLHKTEAFKITASDIANEAKAINNIRFVDWVNEGESFKITVDKDSEVQHFGLYENGNAVKFKLKNNGNIATIEFSLDTTGEHTLALYYSYGNSTIEYGNINVFVREYASDENRIYSVDYPQESYAETVEVSALTSADVENLSLVCGENTVEMIPADVEGMKLWTAEINIADGKEYILYMNSQATQTVIAPTLLEISINLTELNLNSGESFVPEITVSPYIPDNFTLEAVYDDDVISFDGETITALQPGYTRLVLSVGNTSFGHTIYVYVGGGPRKADINGDGKINSLDALIVLQTSVGELLLNEAQTNAADINGDGKINSLDALIILQISTQQKSIWDYV